MKNKHANRITGATCGFFKSFANPRIEHAKWDFFRNICNHKLANKMNYESKIMFIYSLMRCT